MSTRVGDLDHIASLLQSFVDDLNRYCNRYKTDNHFLGGTPALFDYVSRLAAGTSTYLNNTVTAYRSDFPDNQPEDDREPTEEQTKEELRTIRKLDAVNKYWTLLHSQLKQAADANTLSVPVPLVNMACDLLKRIPGMTNIRLVVLHTPELMYYQKSYKTIREAGTRLANKIPEAKFGDAFGVVELPYSQGPSLFTNLVLFHELGHVVFDDVSRQTEPDSFLSTLSAQIEYSLTEHIPGYSGLQLDSKSYLRGILLRWSEEVFSDLFAVHLLGPAFSFGLLDLVSLLGQNHSEALREFVPSHPALAYRFRLHFEALTELGWPLESPSLDNSRLQLIKALAAIPHADYKLRADDCELPRAVLEAFLKTVEYIKTRIKGLTDSTVTRGEGYVKISGQVMDALRNGIVPSLIWKSSKPQLSDRVYIINAAYQFSLTDLGTLVKSVKLKPEVNTRPKRLSFWNTRLEGWTLKALDDYELLDRCRGAGGSE
jgi:hypothetical protein